MKPTNKQLKELRVKVSDLQKDLFNVLGGKESFKHRAKLGDISNEILFTMKENEINGDNTVNYI